MFGSDPAKTLTKARRLLAEGDAPGALRLARKAQGRARPPLAGEIAALVEEARRAAVAAAEERAEASAAEGFFADAAEWLRGGLAHAEGEDERVRLTARLHELEELTEAGAAAESAESGWDWGEGGEGGEDGEDGEAGGEGDGDEPASRSPGRTGLEAVLGGGPRIEPPVAATGPGAGAVGEGALATDELYEAFVDSLRDDVAPRYRGRPPEFRRALLDFADPADSDAAQAAISTLAEADPADPVFRLERGRWRLAKGDAAGARADLEAAWAEFGDRPLDLGGVVSIPEMWCAAALAAGDHAAVLERLEERGELTMSDPELSLFYAQALLAAGEDAEARSFLAESHQRFPRRTDLAYLLAATLHRGGDAPGAIEVLERSLRACGRGCSASDLHPPSLRLLAALYAEAGGPIERLGDVLLLLRGARGGELEPADWQLQARYHDLAGEPAAAERARARAAGVPAGVRSPGEGPPPPPAYEDG
jgi:tetratricopeptide (TPR) repeat protein